MLPEKLSKENREHTCILTDALRFTFTLEALCELTSSESSGCSNSIEKKQTFYDQNAGVINPALPCPLLRLPITVANITLLLDVLESWFIN